MSRATEGGAKVIIKFEYTAASRRLSRFRQHLSRYVGIYGVVTVFLILWASSGFHTYPRERWGQELGYVKDFFVKARQDFRSFL